MRNITLQAVRNFYNDHNFKLSNTQVVVKDNVTKLFLWGSCIARKVDDAVQINLQGYNTVTTRERLNGLRGVNLHTKQGTVYLNGKAIHSDEWYEV